jgi:ABC-2 type transport system ATP-binding protein
MISKMAAIEVSQVSKRFGALQALAGIDLRVERGEFFGLLGPNGAGKTTLISILAGLARADGGNARIMGHDVARDYRAARRSLGVVPQELVFDPFFTVRETLRIQSGYFGLRDNDRWIDEIMASLDLSGKADANMRSLSGGMKRRVLVAQALVHKPPVIVLDEPTAGVDVELRKGLWKFIQRLNRDGHTIVLTTHYLEEAELLCGRIAMLKQGRIVALDSTANLLRRLHSLNLLVRLRSGNWPESLPAAETPENGRVIKLRDYAEVEPALAALRAAGCEIDEMEIQKPDLEDVFLETMRRE